MAQRPELPKEIKAEIERARQAIFKDAPKRFDLLFYPVRIFPEFMIEGPGLDVPKQRMPETVKQQLGKYAGALFDAEARQRVNYTPANFEMLVVYLTELGSEIEGEVRAVAAKEQLNFHCTFVERVEAIREGLLERHKFWVIWWKEAMKLLADEPKVRRLAPPDDTTKPKNRATHKVAPEPAQEQQGTIHLARRLDATIARLDITHDELARRMHIGKTTYFAVKGGHGKQSTRLKVEQYLDKMDKNEP